MKKKIIVCSIVSSFFALAIGTILSNINFDKNVNDFDDVINEVEGVFDNQYAYLLGPKNAYSSEEVIEPKVGVQISELEDEKKSIRFVGLIQDLNVSCSFVRSMYDEYGNIYKEETTYPITTAFSKIKMGESYYTPVELNPSFAGYNYFVTYTMKNIPSSYWYYALDVKLDVTTNTTDEGKITLSGENKANIQGAMKSYYASTFDFTELNDGTYEIAVSDSAKDKEYYEIPEYFNNYEGNVASKGALITAYGKEAFKGCTNLKSFEIGSSITHIGESAFKGCNNLNDIYFEGDLEKWCELSLYNEYSNPMAYASNIYMLNDSNTYELLSEIEIPDSITQIGDFQFYNFKNITNLVLHEDIISFGEKAFYNFSSLDTLYYNGTIDEYRKLEFVDFHSDSSNYAKKFYVKTSQGVYEEYIKEETGNGGEKPNPTVKTIEFITYDGHFETAYAEWKFYDNASGYNAYYKLNSASSWTQVDNELIRSYPNYVRVDVLGLKTGDYTIKVIPIINGKEFEDGSSICSMNVLPHDRSGYAFVNGTSSGAYNDDGTLKSNALVVYVTNDTKDTVTVTPNISDGGKSFTGLGNIVLNWKTKYDNRPLNVRLIGNIEDCSSFDKGDLLVDGSELGITIEGVGNDATANGWGIRIKGSSNVEIRNIGLMNCNSSEGDNIGLQQDNNHIWIHNNDFFYGDAGSDKDQAKGDGALDTKKSTYVTHSYNHFWDTGKTHLNGNGDTINNYISYHHNWYDHSDSRHPRVRCSSAIHVYNNYFDGVAKYGIGATMGSSIYVEGNYFRNTKNPMMISKQGTDAIGEGTFSGEDGGMIKAYDNCIIDASSYLPYSSSNTVEFDSYEVTSRNATVPSSVKTKSGGTSYSNFDTASNFYSYFYESPEKAKETVINYAGRVQGGDFRWIFNNAVDDKSSDVNIELKSALKSYKTKLVSVGGGSISGGTGGDVTIDASEIIGRIDALNNAATFENISEIKEVYNEYLTYEKSYVTNSSKIERLYEEALALEINHFEDLVDICGNELTLTNLETASKYYETLTSAQQSKASVSKAKLDAYYEEYVLIAGQEVYELIEALPSPNDVTLNDEEKINNALNAYNSLNSSQKEVVTNYSKLIACYNTLTELKNVKIASEFIDEVNALPTKNNLKASDLNAIESLINEYESYTSEVKALIDSSYTNKLKDYKTYINENFVTEVTVSVALADLDEKSGTTENGFIYETNGEDESYIKLKGTNNLTYNVETSSITMELVAKCTDSSESKEFTVVITYKDGSSDTFTYETASGRADTTYLKTYTGDIVSISVYGIEGKNLGVKSLKLTYSASSKPEIDASEIIARIDALDDNASLENAATIKEVYADYLAYDKSLVTNADKIEKLYADVLVLEIERFDYLVTIAVLNFDVASFEEAYEYYDTLNSNQQVAVASRKAELDSYYDQFLNQPGPSADVIEFIDELPSIEDITLSDEILVDRTRALYDNLNDQEKEKVTNYSKLVELENRIAVLKVSKETADTFISKVDSLPEKEELTSNDLSTIEAFINEYNSFDNDVKSFINESYITKLNECKTYIESLENSEDGSISIGGLFDNWSKDGTYSDFSDLWN